MYIVPIAEEVVPGWYEDARVRFKVRLTEQFDMGKGQRHLERQLAERDIALVPVAECLRGHPAPELLYLKVDGHTTAAGNTAIAQCLYDYMAKEQLPAARE